MSNRRARIVHRILCSIAHDQVSQSASRRRGSTRRMSSGCATRTRDRMECSARLGDITLSIRTKAVFAQMIQTGQIVQQSLIQYTKEQQGVEERSGDEFKCVGRRRDASEIDCSINRILLLLLLLCCLCCLIRAVECPSYMFECWWPEYESLRGAQSRHVRLPDTRIP